MADTKETCLLYLITPPVIEDLQAFAKVLDDVLATGEVVCLQLRLKGADDETIVGAAETLLPICHAHEVALLINDRADIAEQTGADGVHLGQNDGGLASARSLLGADKDIGVTCHASKDMAFQAGDQGANYVAFGACFESETKPDADVVGTETLMEILTDWDEVTDVPCVAIGGITPENCRQVADAGAHFVAVSGSVWGHKDGPVAAVKAFGKALA
ncbi:MAG: thiamine phosphate synthase [Kordiimonadales bacterium]|nr:MAG: thiamine phosphate synthase [Kordiimonadales bacterium]